MLRRQYSRMYVSGRAAAAVQPCVWLPGIRVHAGNVAHI